jgi:hypothetical protein
MRLLQLVRVQVSLFLLYTPIPEVWRDWQLEKYELQFSIAGRGQSGF